jgi:hypothetical protein
MSKQPAFNGPVFLSYASEDADAATRICDALRRAGIEVWFDREELCGGDSSDSKIRKQIHDCALWYPYEPGDREFDMRSSRRREERRRAAATVPSAAKDWRPKAANRLSARAI